MDDIKMLPDGRMDTKNAALYLGFDEGTMANWRVTGGGPSFIKPGGKVFYYRSDLDSWLNRRRGETTAKMRLTPDLDELE